MKKENGARSFLDELVAGVSIPGNGDEFLGSHGYMAPIVERAIFQKLPEIPPETLVSYLKKTDRYVCADAQFDLLTGITSMLCNLDSGQVGKLNQEEIIYLAVHPRCDRFHYLLRGNVFRGEWDNRKHVIFKSAKPEIQESLCLYFEKSFSKFIEKISFRELKNILKDDCYIEEYLPIITVRARTLLNDISTQDVGKMRIKYGGNHRKCRMGKIFPVVEECYLEKIFSEIISTRSIKEFISKSIHSETRLTEEMVIHFQELLNGVNAPEEIENAFAGVMQEMVPERLQGLMKSRYVETVKSHVESQKSELVWLWRRLSYSPFKSETVFLLDIPLRNALKSTDAEFAWNVVKVGWFGEGFRPYYRIAKQKYVMWLTRRIDKEPDVGKLRAWFDIGGRRSKGRILVRLRSLWEPLSFMALATNDACRSVNRMSEIKELRETMLNEKLPKFVRSNPSLVELVVAYGFSTLSTEEKFKIFKEPFEKVFSRMSRKELEGFDGYGKIEDRFLLDLAGKCLKDFVDKDIANENLGLGELLDKAEKIPETFGILSRLLINEVDRRVQATDDLAVLEGYLRTARNYYLASNRYLEILPTFLKTASRDEIGKRFRKCPEDLKGDFVQILLEIANVN